MNYQIVNLLMETLMEDLNQAVSEQNGFEHRKLPKLIAHLEFCAYHFSEARRKLFF